MNFAARLERITAELENHGIDALLVTSLANVRYLTGFSGSNAQLLVRREGAVFFSDGRYSARAADLVREARIEIYRDYLREVLPAHLNGIGRLGVEANNMTLAQHEDHRRHLSGVELVATKGLIEDFRRVKDSGELELIERAVELTDGCWEYLLGVIGPGLMERDVSIRCEMWLRDQGADVAFDPIVASGPLGSHIHHTPSERRLEVGDLVLCDFGAGVEGYAADLTRTVVLGPSTELQRTAYEAVLGAQEAAVDLIRPDASCREVDAAARAFLAGAGFQDFAHGLGHGIGLEVHETPQFRRTAEESLRAGEVMTVEPGIYRGDLGGIRIEDCLVVEEGGARILSAAPKKELLEL